MDVSLSSCDKTDTFGCIVYEDTIDYTDYIVDSLSPRW